MSTRTERAAQLRAQISGILTEAITDGDRIPVTSDARELDRASLARGIVLVSPGPRLEWPSGPGATRLTWTVYVLQKPGNASEEWEQVDGILDALIAARFPMEEGEPVEVPRPDPAPTLTGYTVKITDDYLNPY